MIYKHYFQILQTGSPYMGRICPVTRTELGTGEHVVVCHKNDEVFSWDVLPVLDGRCPFCEQQIAFEEILGPSRRTYGKTSGPTKEKADKPKAKPGYVPAQRRNGVPLVLVALGILALMGICGIGGVIGYRQFFAQPTAVPTAQLAAQATEIPTVMEPTTASSAVEVPESTNTPQPTTTPMLTHTPEPTATPIPSPTPCTVSVYGTFLGIWQANESQLGCPVSIGRSGVWVAQESFQHGLMIWREDNDKIYVLYNNGSWERYDDIWYEGDAPFTCGTASSPPTPQRGFGKIWCTYGAVRQRLGDATNAEWGVHSALQEFSGGLVLQVGSGKTYIFYSDGTWR